MAPPEAFLLRSWRPGDIGWAIGGEPHHRFGADLTGERWALAL